jgi:hypothetical protein
MDRRNFIKSVAIGIGAVSIPLMADARVTDITYKVAKEAFGECTGVYVQAIKNNTVYRHGIICEPNEVSMVKLKLRDWVNTL